MFDSMNVIIIDILVYNNRFNIKNRMKNKNWLAIG